MTKFLKSIGLAGLACLVALIAVAPASAQPWPYYRHYYRPYYARPYYPRPYYPYYYNPGAAIAGSIVGGVFGAIAGSALRGGSSHVARCERAYRSYQPSTNTYVGYDGVRHICRL